MVWPRNKAKLSESNKQTNEWTQQANKMDVMCAWCICVHLCMRFRQVDRFFLFHSWFIVIEIVCSHLEIARCDDRWPIGPHQHQRYDTHWRFRTQRQLLHSFESDLVSHLTFSRPHSRMSVSAVCMFTTETAFHSRFSHIASNILFFILILGWISLPWLSTHADRRRRRWHFLRLLLLSNIHTHTHMKLVENYEDKIEWEGTNDDNDGKESELVWNTWRWTTEEAGNSTIP